MSDTRVTRTSKRKKQTQQFPVDTPVDENQDKATTNKGKRSKLDVEIERFPHAEMFPDIDIKMEEYTDEDYNVNPIKPTVKHKPKLTSKKCAKGKNGKAIKERKSSGGAMEFQT
jgi:hypothetical protein